MGNPLRVLLADQDQPIELVFGLVGPTGVNLSDVAAALESQLRAVDYSTVHIRLSELLLKAGGKKESDFEEYERIATQIRIGNEICSRVNAKDMVGRLGLTEIRRQRALITGHENTPHKTIAVAYVVRSFKRKEEVELYRNIYGKAFVLISVYAPRHTRISALASRFRSIIENEQVRGPQELATRIVDRDYKEYEDEYGQRVGKTFPLADYFVSVGPRVELERQLGRLVRLVLGDPYISPTREEQGMFFAQAAALRSLDLSRQVGASIMTGDGEVLSTGCNEVPKFRGGLYWADDPGCQRDVERGYDANIRIKAELVEDAIQILRSKGWTPPGSENGKTDAELAKGMLFGEQAYFEGAKLYDVIEFGRAVHAEMDAISQAARLGISLQNAKLFCTTFPCHICARHIVATGISEVWFIEPYEKSRTADLYSDSISVEPHEPSAAKANFRAFVGVAPRRYMDLFQMTADRKNVDGQIRSQKAKDLKPRFRRFVLTYILTEIRFEEEYVELLRAKEKRDDPRIQ